MRKFFSAVDERVTVSNLLCTVNVRQPRRMELMRGYGRHCRLFVCLFVVCVHNKQQIKL